MRLLYRPLVTFTRYRVPYNINKQQNLPYLKRIERAQDNLKNDISSNSELIPRRKRRIYDRPRIDRNIEGYGAWRVFQADQLMYKVSQHSMTVDLKIRLPPKWIIHAFGVGMIPESNPRSSHREYYFQDNRLNNYLLYQYRNTTHFRQNQPDEVYENQQKRHPRTRISKRLSPEQFWKSQELFQFRVNGSLYAQKFKFQAWLLQQIQKAKKSTKSYDEYIDEKYGTVCTFNNKSQAQRFEANKPIVTIITPQHFNPPQTQTQKKGKKTTSQMPVPKVHLGTRMDEKFRIKQDITGVSKAIQDLAKREQVKQNKNQ